MQILCCKRALSLKMFRKSPPHPAMSPAARNEISAAAAIFVFLFIKFPPRCLPAVDC